MRWEILCRPGCRDVPSTLQQKKVHVGQSRILARPLSVRPLPPAGVRLMALLLIVVLIMIVVDLFYRRRMGDYGLGGLIGGAFGTAFGGVLAGLLFNNKWSTIPLLLEGIPKLLRPFVIMGASFLLSFLAGVCLGDALWKVAFRSRDGHPHFPDARPETSTVRKKALVLACLVLVGLGAFGLYQLNLERSRPPNLKQR